MNRAQPFAEYLAEGWFNIFVWRNKIGEIWGNFLKKSAKTVVSGSKTGKNGRFLRSQLASDSVIRWFESSYPSHGYHILYKECASKYNIWFLFYLAGFILPFIVGKIVGYFGAKGRRFIGYNRSFAPLARDTLSSSRYSLCPRRRTSRPCRTNDPPRA